MNAILRRANATDDILLLRLRNDPETVLASFSERIIGPEEHRAWYAEALKSRDTAIFILEEAHIPVGQVRLERVEPKVAEVHIAIDRAHRGRGLAVKALQLARSPARAVLGVTQLRAFIKPSNERSQRAFRAAGFVETARDPKALVLELRLSP